MGIADSYRVLADALAELESRGIEVTGVTQRWDDDLSVAVDLEIPADARGATRPTAATAVTGGAVDETDLRGSDESGPRGRADPRHGLVGVALRGQGESAVDRAVDGDRDSARRGDDTETEPSTNGGTASTPAAADDRPSRDAGQVRAPVSSDGGIVSEAASGETADTEETDPADRDATRSEPTEPPGDAPDSEPGGASGSEPDGAPDTEREDGNSDDGSPDGDGGSPDDDDDGPAVSEPDDDDSTDGSIPCRDDDCDATFESEHGMKIHYSKVHRGDGGTPPYEDPEALREVYERHGTFAEMTAALDVDVSPNTVRRYMIEHGIHDPRENGGSGTRTEDPDASANRSESDGDSEVASEAGDSDDTDDTDDSNDIGDTGDTGDTDDTETNRVDSDAESSDEGPTMERDVGDDARSDGADEYEIPEDAELPRGVTVEDVAAAVASASTVYEVGRDLRVSRERAQRLLRDLGLLDLVTGRLATRPDPDRVRREVDARLRGATRDGVGAD